MSNIFSTGDSCLELPVSNIQLFRERMSIRRVRVFAKMPKGSMGDIQ